MLNQLPLPSPLPATTTKSLLYNGRIAEEVSCLLSRRDDTLVSQLAHSLNQVSTEHMWVSHLGLLPSVHPHQMWLFYMICEISVRLIQSLWFYMQRAEGQLGQ